MMLSELPAQGHVWRKAEGAGRGWKRSLKRILLPMLAVACLHPAQAEQSPNGVNVALPNGYARLKVEDLRVQSTAGPVRWVRSWDNTGWKFNAHWESLSQLWTNLTGSQIADGSGGTLTRSGGASDGENCWVYADEERQDIAAPLTGGTPTPLPRDLPFNRVMGEVGATDYVPAKTVTVDYASLCPGVSISGGSAVRDYEGLRRGAEMYLGENGRYAFNNRTILEQRSVRQLPADTANNQYTSLAVGHMAIAPINNPKGYRWIDKGGDWIDYNTQGQVVAWGDKNNNTVWLLRDTDGILRGVLDSNGRVIYSLHYTGANLTEVRDYAASADDLPARAIVYTYNTITGKLEEVRDEYLHTVKYGYDPQTGLVAKITDPEQHEESLYYVSNRVLQHIAPDGGVTDYEYQYDGANRQFISKLTGPQTLAGRRIEDLTHDRAGRLVRRLVNGQGDEEVHHDASAHTTTITNARGFTTTITRNEFEQITQIDYPGGANKKYGYSALHLQLTETTDELGVRTEYRYDTKGNPQQKTEAVGTVDERITDYETNPLGQITKVTRRGRTEANGTVTPDAIWKDIQYDALGQISQATDPEGKIWKVSFYRSGDLASITDPRGNKTRYDIDASGKLTLTDALNHSRQYLFDGVGNLAKVIDARQKTWLHAHDAMRRYKGTTNPVQGTSNRDYNQEGLPTTLSDADQHSLQLEFDNFLRLVKLTDAKSNVTTFDYTIADGSAAGTLGSLFGPTEIRYPTFTEKRGYDGRERQTTQILVHSNRLGAETLGNGIDYYANGLPKTTTDAYEKSRGYAYTKLGQLKEYTDARNKLTQVGYDARGNLLQLTDANLKTTKFEYDLNDRLKKETLPLGQVTTYDYDDAGNPRQRIDPNGNRIEYTLWDAANRLKEVKQYNVANVQQRLTTYDWDEEGHLTGWTDVDLVRNQTTRSIITYDDAGRRKDETVTYPGGYSLSYGYGYTPAGYKNRLTWPDGSNIGYGYSSHGVLESVTIPGEGSISVNQFKWLAPTKLTLPGGTTQEKGYDGLLNPESLKVKTPGQQLSLDLQNTWGRVQELKANSRTDQANNVSTTRNGSYGYDDETRLRQAQTDTGGLFTDTETFTLDDIANRTAHSRISGDWTYDDNQRLRQRGTDANATTYDYDDAGNLTQQSQSGKVTRYGYDSQNRLSDVRDGSDNPIARYGYDPLNRRIWKELYRDNAGSLLAQATRTFYFYADEGLIAEATQPITLNADGSVSDNGTPTLTTQYGPKPDNPFTTGMLFVKTKASNGQDLVAYYQHDHLQTPLQALDKQGRLVWSATYNVFGQATITTPAATPANPTITSNLRLPGQYEDAETGLHYNWHRYYDNSTGRYTQRDPIGLDGGVNNYAYVDGSPFRYIDSSGLIIDTFWDLGNVIYDIWKGQWCDLAADTAAMLIPGVPAGITKLRTIVKSPRNAHLAGKVHPNTGIPFDKAGYPDFSGVAKAEVEIAQTGSRAGDFRAANEAAGFPRTPEGYTWHHHQNGTTMQLVPRDIHAQTGHTGGFNAGR